MIVPAHAKVNLTLEVLGKRPDGYHEIRSVMRLLALHDRIRLEPATEVTVRCDLPGLSGPGNLAHRAALLLREEAGYRGGAAIGIEKTIPVAAGLGGGSSDAAATLLGLDRLWGTGLGRETLQALAAQLGSDVPFFLYGGTALASGRGELIRPLPVSASGATPVLLLVKPPIAVPTSEVYRHVTAALYGDGSASAALAALPPDAPAAAWPLLNALQPVTESLFPVVGEVLAALPAWGAERALLCGSGPTCFGLFAADAPAEAAASKARSRGWQAWVTAFV